jgi:hypothetical protein
MPLRLTRLIVAGVLVATGLVTGLVTGVVASSAGASSSPVTTITLQGSRAYTPHAPPQATDDYHCTLVNPHTKTNSFIVASHFYPNSIEVHHAILFLVPPDLAKAALAADSGARAGPASARAHYRTPSRPIRSPTRRGSRPGLRVAERTRNQREPGSNSLRAAWWSCRSTTTSYEATNRSRPN